MKNQIGRKVRKLRELRNFTQTYMADALELTQQAYSKIEKDGRLTVEQLEKIAHILDVDVAFILTFDEAQLLSATPPQAYNSKARQGISAHADVMDPGKGIRFYEEMIHLMKKEIDCLYAIAFPATKPV